MHRKIVPIFTNDASSLHLFLAMNQMYSNKPALITAITPRIKERIGPTHSAGITSNIMSQIPTKKT